MIKNYIKIALRTLWRDRAFSFINLIGLSVGLASVLMIMAYVRFELSYDKSYSNSPNVYRLQFTGKSNGVDVATNSTPTGLAAVLQKDFPGIISYTLFNANPVRFLHGTEKLKMNIIRGTAGFFKVFNLKFINGNAADALKDPNTVVITQKTAEKYFPGVANPVGRTIYNVDEQKNLRVSGVIENIPSNTHFNAESILSSEEDRGVHDVFSIRAYTGRFQYILLNKNSNASVIESRFKSIYQKYNFPKDMKITLQPVTSIHLHSHTDGELMPNGDIKYVYIFSSVALLILLIACINYINLATARSIQRAREVGVRKVLGAVKGQLVWQFLSESFMFFVVCLVLAILLAYMGWPALSQIINNNEAKIPLFDGGSVLFSLFIVIVFGLLSGMYPAFFLSKVKTSSVLKGVTGLGVNVSFRKLLVAVQFIISGVLIVSTLIIYQQLKFVSNARLGFNKDNLITVPFFMDKIQSHVSAFKNELKENPDITAVSVASWKAGKYFGSSSSMTDENNSSKRWEFQFIDADPDFIKSMDIKVLKGRDFSRSNPADMFNVDSAADKQGDNYNAYKRVQASRPIIVNEETLKMLGLQYKDNLVINKGSIQGTVVGMVQNFNGLTLHEKIPSIVIRCYPDDEFGHMYIRISPKNTQQTIAYIQKKWAQFYPDQSFEFNFVDQQLQQLYTADKRVGQLFGIFTSITIMIACLGLFGLISLTVQQRVKEIGIRKVLGASVANITTLLSVDFLALVFISMAIASPVAWYIMNKWLDSFAYHVQITWVVFAVSAISAVIIAFVTVSFQAIRAATANPVESLRSE